MPQRFLRPGITTSDKFNSVPWDTQVFFVRLLTLVDDYGRYDAHPLLLKGHAFAMRPDVTVERIIEMRDELSKSGLVTFYEVKGKEFLQVEKWQERARTSSRYPSSDGTESKPEGRVYFVIAKQSKRIKIGYTCYKPEARLSTLQTGSAEPLELLGVLVGGPELERELHRKHKGMSCGGEWFTDCPEIRQEIILGSLKTNGSDQPNLLPPSPSSLAIDHKPSPSPAVPATPSFSEIPSWGEFFAYCQIHGGPVEWYAKDKFLAAEQDNWKGKAKWTAYADRVRGWWVDAGRPMVPVGVNGQKKPKSRDIAV